MSTVVNTNVAALRAVSNLAATTNKLNSSLEKLSSGYKINKGADDPSGLAISNTMDAQIGGTRQAIANASDGISLIQTADGAMEETKNMLLRMRDLAVKASNDATLTTADQAKINSEYQVLMSEIDSKLTRVTFNTKQILNGAVNGASLQVGPGTGQTIAVTISTQDSTALKVNGTTVSTAAQATKAISALDQGLSALSTVRADLGTVQRRLNHVINDLTSQDVNLSAARSRIMDTDFAAEVSNYTKAQILQQVGNSIFAQANSAPQAVIRLVG